MQFQRVKKSGSVLYALHLNNHQRKTFILLILKFRLTYNATFTKIKIIPFFLNDMPNYVINAVEKSMHLRSGSKNK